MTKQAHPRYRDDRIHARGQLGSAAIVLGSKLPEPKRTNLLTTSDDHWTTLSWTESYGAFVVGGLSQTKRLVMPTKIYNMIRGRN